MAPLAASGLLLIAIASSLGAPANAQGQGRKRAAVQTLGLATPGTPGLPALRMAGSPQVGQPFQLEVTNARPLSVGFLYLGAAIHEHFVPALGASAFVTEPFVVHPFALDAAGSSGPLLGLGSVMPSLCDRSLVAQATVMDPAAVGGMAVSKALAIRFGRAPSPQLFPGTKYTVDGAPYSLATGDLNGDGVLDVVAGVSGDVSVLLGDASGALGPAQNTGSGTFGSVALGDLNGDGTPDIVQARRASTGEVVVQLGNGDGTFSAPQAFPAGGNIAANLAFPAPVLEDLNRDGALDVALPLVVNTESRLAVLLGNGDGTLATPRTTFVASGFDIRYAAAADLDGDLVPDLLVSFTGTISLDEVWVLLGVGDGSFQTPFSVATGSALTGQPLAVGDLNADGALDVVAGDKLLLGVGDGSFSAVLPLPASGADVALADVDLDGNLDLVVLIAFGGAEVRILPGAGDGTFGAESVLATGVRPNDLTIADLEGNGKPDILVSNLDSRDVSVFLSRGDGRFAVLPEFPTGSISPLHLAAGDADGDQLADLVITNYNQPLAHELTLLSGLGNGSFAAPVVIPFPGTLTDVAIADLDGDQLPDLLLNRNPNPSIFPPTQIAVLRGLGGGAFAPAVGYTASRPIAIATGDLDLDGVTDVAAVSDTGLLSVLLGAGDGTLQPFQLYQAGWWLTDLVIADFDGDGAPDVAASDRDNVSGGLPRPGAIRILLGVGDGSFPTSSVLSVSLDNASSAQGVATGDLNGDGVLDLVAAVNNGFGNDGCVSVLLGRGDGTFESFVSYPAGRGPESVAVADLNGDLLADVVVGNRSSQDVDVFLSNADGTLQPFFAFPIGGSALALALEDFNGDQVPDLAAIANDADIVRVLPNLLLR